MLNRLSLVAWTLGLACGFVCATTSVRAQPAEDKPAGVLFAGIAEDESGKQIARATIEFKISGKPARAVSQDDGKFEVRIAEPPKVGFNVLAKSPDGELLASLRVPGEGEPPLDRQALRLVLKPAKKIEVIVTDGKKQPIAGALAGVITDYIVGVTQEVTDAQGHALLRVPADSIIHFVYAWQHGLGLDYRSYEKPRGKANVQKNALPPPTAPIALELTGSRSLRVTLSDGDGKPLSGVALYPWLLTKPEENSPINLSGAIETFGATTDQSGVAAWDWIPAWQQQIVILWPQSQEFTRTRLLWNPKAQGDTAKFVLHRLEWLRGKVTHPDGVPAPGIKIQAAGQGYDADNFQGETQTDADGKYALRVAPNNIYLVVVRDDKWAAPAQTGFAVLPKTPVPDKDFVLRPATRVLGRLTLGKDKKPYANESVYLYQQGADNQSEAKDLLPNSSESRRHVQPIIYFDARTDADGRFEFQVGPGKFVARGPAQIKPIIITVKDEPQIELNLHATRPETAKLKLKVVTGTPPQPVAAANIVGRFRGGPPGSVWIVTTTADGTVEAERQTYPMIVTAKSADKKLAGMMEIGPADESATVTLAATASVRGRLVDAGTNAALADRDVTGHVDVYSGDKKVSSLGLAPVTRTKTDADGRFELTDLVPGAAYVLHASAPTAATLQGKGVTKQGPPVAPIQSVLLKPGETKDLGDIKWPLNRPPTIARVSPPIPLNPPTPSAEPAPPRPRTALWVLAALFAATLVIGSLWIWWRRAVKSNEPTEVTEVLD